MGPHDGQLLDLSDAVAEVGHPALGVVLARLVQDLHLHPHVAVVGHAVLADLVRHRPNHLHHLAVFDCGELASVLGIF